MTNKIHIVFCCLVISYQCVACDICGNYMGITPYDTKNSISFLHRYRIFNGYRNYQQQRQFFPKNAYRVTHGSTPDDTSSFAKQMHSSKDFESYKIFELRLKYFAFKRLETNLFIPLLNNKSKTNDLYTSTTGLGDISLNIGYHTIIPNLEKNTKQKLIVGLGIKLPTGNHYAHDKNSDRLPFEMQPGTGSVDGFSYINYMLALKNWGLNLSMNYKVNGKNNYNERLANSHNHFISLFYKKQYKAFTFYPSVVANYEYTDGLAIKKQLQKNTDVHALLIGPGLDIIYKSFSINTSWQFTAIEKVNVGNLKGSGRITFGINYMFNNRENK